VQRGEVARGDRRGDGLRVAAAPQLHHRQLVPSSLGNLNELRQQVFAHRAAGAVVGQRNGRLEQDPAIIRARGEKI
jgi:hypothetical protein